MSPVAEARAEATPFPVPGPLDPHASRTAADVMRAGVVLVDADVSVRAVARAMRDRGVRTVLAVDISSELVGLIDERAVASAVDDPDEKTAASIMNPDPHIVSPDAPLATVAREMLERSSATVLVAPPPPAEESGVWSEWKERGMPLGTLSVADILGRLDELASAVRVPPARTAGTARRAAPWIAVASLVVLVILLALLVFAYAHGTHQYTNRPGLQ